MAAKTGRDNDRVTIVELTRIQKIILAAGLLIIIGGVFVLSLRSPETPPHHVNLVAQDPPPEEQKQIVVHVAGAVQNPGLYRLPENARVVNAVRAAGGFTEKADEEAVNLAAKLTDGQKLVIQQIPTSAPDTETATTQPDRDSSTSRTSPPPNPQTASAHSRPDTEQTVRRKISINTAQPQQLAMLPGIGETLARRIAYYRHQNGPFRRIEDLTAVDGIGDDTLQKIRPYITL